MADYVALSGNREEDAEAVTERKARRPRIASLDVFRGLTIALMIFVDYAGSLVPFVAHSPWHGIQLADVVTPFFLFIVGISASLVYKETSNRIQTTQKAMLRAVKLFLLGILLQGGYFHGVNSLSYGINIEKIRWFGILQRIAVGYIVAALCEIWLSNMPKRNAVRVDGFLRNYFLHWVILVSLSGIYLGLLYGLYVPDWQFQVEDATLTNIYSNSTYITNKVKCGVRGDLGPACNSAGMIDRYVVGIEHLYKKSAYRNLKTCQNSKARNFSDNSASWCQAPFDPEGLLGSLMAVVNCILGLQYGHVLVQLEDHKDRLIIWLQFSVSFISFGLFLHLIGDPLNKQLYTISYVFLTTGLAGLTFCALYYLVDVAIYRCLTFPLEWTGRHSLSIFILVASNIVVIIAQGFYWRDPKTNLVHWVISLFVPQ
ncbi:hypothetical protein KSP39_PZI012586 [Platanthera zijinensis]|uniref:Heparan-alpha-glucosaminide N-acetyltransferase catalytic domain-containing protein n=1 Tax=Platanthera zijinensis TaxID=2320716 RepID=A0AAP0G4Q9_9ASPA